MDKYEEGNYIYMFYSDFTFYVLVIVFHWNNSYTTEYSVCFIIIKNVIYIITERQPHSGNNCFEKS